MFFPQKQLTWQNSTLVDIALSFSKIRSRLSIIRNIKRYELLETQKQLEQRENLDANSILRIENLWKEWLTRLHLMMEITHSECMPNQHFGKLSHAFITQNAKILLEKNQQHFCIDSLSDSISKTRQRINFRNDYFIGSIIQQLQSVDQEVDVAYMSPKNKSNEKLIKKTSSKMAVGGTLSARATIIGKFYVPILR